MCDPETHPISVLHLSGESHPSIRALAYRSQVSEIQDHMEKLKARLEYRQHFVMWVWTVEPNPRRTGNHIHGYLRDPTFTVDQLREVATSRGIGMGEEVHLEPIPYPVPLTYFSYLTKYITTPQTLARYRYLNGAKVLHPSQGFWLDGKGVPTTLTKLERAQPPAPAGWKAQHAGPLSYPASVRYVEPVPWDPPSLSPARPLRLKGR